MAREWTRASIQEADGLTAGRRRRGWVEWAAPHRRQLPHVVVLDVHLPDISGVEVARRVRTALPEIGIVVATGFGDPTYAQALLQIGVRGYLTKSASAEEIVHAVREAAAGRTVISSDAARNSVSDSQAALGPTERQLLALLDSVRRNAEIATALDVSLTVVEYRIGQLLQLLGAAPELRRSRWVTSSALPHPPRRSSAACPRLRR